MDSLDKLVAIASEFSAIPLIGKCLFCTRKDCNKAAIIQNCQIKQISHPHEAVLVFLCPEHYNDGVIVSEELRLKVANLDPSDWEIING